MTSLLRYRLIAGPIFLIVLTLGCASGSRGGTKTGGPPPRDARAYYPLAAGWKWAYNVTQDGQSILATYGVLSNDGARARVQAGNETLVYELREDGVLRTDGSARGDHLLKTPIEKGATWKLAMGNAEVTEVGITVEVPAGRFDNCVVVKELRIEPDRVSFTTYAPGVGPVKMQYQATEHVAGEIEQLFTELLGFTRPGEDPFGGRSAGKP